MQANTKELLIQEEFDRAFREYREKKIVLYGIGLRTAMLMPVIRGNYNVIGLMDRETGNIGKSYYGFPVLSREEVENGAEMIIINTAESYWGTIYERICEMKTPIYFANGQRAEKRIRHNVNLEYWNKDLRDFKAKAACCQVVSFDLYDTLLERRLVSPMDVFSLLERASNRRIMDIRRRAILDLGDDYNMEELYGEMKELDKGITDEEWNRIMLLEMQIEKAVAVPRKAMVSLYNEFMDQGKEIYIITDMYLPKGFLMDLMADHGIQIDEDHFIESGYIKKNKSSGALWKYYMDAVLCGKKAVHIGDNEKGDVESASRYGLEAAYIMSGTDLFKSSSLCEAEGLGGACSDMLILGLVKSRLFNNPYALNKSRGEVLIENKKDFGYCIWGPVMLSFLQWLMENAKKDGVETLLFAARDGYFILDCFEYMCLEMEGESAVKGKYLATSRRAASVASIQNEHDFEEVCKLPYIGCFADYMEDRFDVKISRSDNMDKINISEDYDKVLEMMKPYESALRSEISRERRNYRRYLDGVCGSRKCAVVDTGYMGSIQNNIMKLLEKSVQGYYFYANLSEGNPLCGNISMKACFQKEEDKTAAKSNIYGRLHLIESFLTAPHGMVKYVNDSGQVVYNETGKNQQYFEAREMMNKGIKEFIHDYLTICREVGIGGESGNPLFVDELFGKMMENCRFSEEIKEVFYREDSFLRRQEVKIF